MVGLTSSEAEKRLKQYGLNEITKHWEVKFWSIAKEEVSEPMIILLLVVGVFYTIWGKLEDALTIFTVITILVFVEIWNEYRAKKSIESLSKMAAPTSRVIRNNHTIEVRSENLVPGDVIILTTGTRIPGDAELIEQYSLQVDESSLTGESVPIDKRVKDKVYAGTLVVGGEAKAEILQTGLDTRIGRLSKMAEAIKPPKTQLQLSMKDLSGKLVWVALFFSIIIPLYGLLLGNNFRDMLLTGLALAFAVIPEELPIIITMILGIGSYNLSKEHLLIKKIKASEALGGATVILTDKTGTITENKMRIAETYPQKDEMEIIKSASRTITELTHTPTDNAIIEKAKGLNISVAGEELLRERGFINGKKTKSVLRKAGKDLILSVSGAPEEVFKLIKEDPKELEKEVLVETKNGKRVIAIAVKIVPPLRKNLSFDKLEKDLEFKGLIAIEDPPRKGVRETITIAKNAGVRTIMVTGDHPETARNIAMKVGISSDKVLTGAELDALSDSELKKLVEEVSVFARTSPEHKYRLVKALHSNGEIVAVTGDGVNDSLALKGADIGIAMGIKGTDAAKEAADIVLADDNYITISKGIFEGRKFYDNLKKGVKYYLSVKLALVLVFLVPLILNMPLPFSPIQIIILELFMDLAASAGFVSEPEEKTIYSRKPRGRTERLIDNKTIIGIIISGLSLFAGVIIAYIYSRNMGLSLVETQSYAFMAWIIGHIILAFTSRSDTEPLYKLGLFNNKLMDIWALLTIFFIILVNTITPISTQLRLSPLTLANLGLIFLISLVTIGWQEIVKMIKYAVNNK
ncbi:Copper-exporting P-type ATPase B [Candidatus Tiddalikarchaeum anstoanum]|nr:Copper-exporting P-type ATPase B [Candidatus Tiddalikarchaeum anstoanum]